MFKKQLQILLLTFLVHAGVYGQSYALDFDGTNDYVTTPIDADLQAMPSTTWSGWIKPTGVSGWQIIFGMEDGGWDRMLLIEPGGGLSLGHTNNRWQTGISIATGAWQHVAVVYDNGAMRFYYNGIAYATTTTEGNHSSAGTFTIGGNQSPGGNYYRGLIDEVAVWNEALTAAEITTLYNSGIGLDAASNSGNYASASNLVGYYKMNEGTGTTIADASSNSNTGTLANMDAADWVTGYNLKPLPTITNFNPYTKTYFDGSFIIINPTSNSTGAFSYTSNNAAVATISGNIVTITGIGTANITATQSEDATYSSGTATVSLTISDINMVLKNGGISNTNPNYVDQHGRIGGANALSKNGALLQTRSPVLPFSGGTFDGFTYNLVTSATTRVWLDRNLGASQVATSSSDALSFGDLYQWGRGTDGHQLRTPAPATTTILSPTDNPSYGNFIIGTTSTADWRSPQNGDLWQGINGKNNPCPIGFRLPTETELNTERLTFSPPNATGAFNSALKLTMAGYRNRSDGNIIRINTHGYYMSSSLNSFQVRVLNIVSGSASMLNDNRANAESVRCIKD